MKIRTRIFLVFVTMIVVGIFALMRWMHEDMRPRYMEAQEDTLVDLSQVLATLISNRGVDAAHGRSRIDVGFLDEGFEKIARKRISAQIYELHKDSVDIRIYVTDHAGRVLFDSDGGRDVGADYSNWRDVHLTLAGEYGARSSEFDPLFATGSTMYIAAPIEYRGDLLGVVSVGKPTRNAERFMEHALQELRKVALLVVVATLAVGFILHGWISRPLQQLHDYAIAIRDGRRNALPALGDNEVARVGEAIDDMRRALDGKAYISSYVQSLTHELKSPLAAIRGAAELLEEDMPVVERQRFLGNILNQTERIQELVDRLLELAAIENRPALENKRPIEIKALFAEAKDSLQPIAAHKEVAVELHVAGEPWVEGEPFLLQKAINNLLKNAIEFSSHNDRVALSARREADQVVVSVADQGPGVPDYANDKVYERFYSLRRPDGQKGSGLGLSFVREIVSLHKGELTLSNRAEGGAVAVLALPPVDAN